MSAFRIRTFAIFLADGWTAPSILDKYRLFFLHRRVVAIQEARNYSAQQVAFQS